MDFINSMFGEDVWGQIIIQNKGKNITQLKFVLNFLSINTRTNRFKQKSDPHKSIAILLM